MTGLCDVAHRLADRPVTIAYMGNSVTAQKDGYRPHLHAGLVKRFGHDHRAVNAGFGGVGSIGSVCTMDDLVIRHRPALCFIECLTGDIGVGVHADTGPALEGMLRKLAAIGTAPCFLNLPRGDADCSLENPTVALYARVAEYHRTPSIDIGPMLKDEASALFRDDVHTTEAGGRRIAELILEALESKFTAPGDSYPWTPLFSRDFSAATVTPMRTDALRDPAACAIKRFRLSTPYVELGPDNEIGFHSRTDELLGLLIVAGPHSGPTVMNNVEYQLRDRWCHYERLHAFVLDKPFPADQLVTISPKSDIRDLSAPPSRLKVIGFLVRGANPPRLHRFDAAACPVGRA